MAAELRRLLILRTILVTFMAMSPRRAPWLAVAGLLLATACGTANGEPGDRAGGRIRVVTTTTQLTDFARQVGGEHVDVYGVLKVNVDPHDYDPSPADLLAIARADVIVKNGVELEAWFDKTLEAANPDALVIDASAGVALRVVDADGPGGGPEHDPHIWQDPRNAKVMVANVEKGLERVDPGGADGYRAAWRAYDAQLDDLDRQIEQQIGTVGDKRLVTNHDAFRYYVDRYGLQLVGSIIPSFDSSAELSVAEREDLVARIRAEHVKAVFSETSLPPKTADAIAQEAGVRVVHGEDSLYGDTLGPAGSDGATYLDVMRHNTRVIVDNLR
jgi:zinc/manganese transport system substrate-binding protein/manganese/iron transport system substrate-binding protein